jgi:hypothetical protein
MMSVVLMAVVLQSTLGGDLQADFSVEMGSDDPVLEVPWAFENANLHYVNLRLEPERLGEIVEVLDCPELAEFLRHLNAGDSVFETVKCDRWYSTDIEHAEEIFGGSHKHGSYCDIVFRDPVARQSFLQNEALVRRLVELLEKAPEFPGAAEFVIRRCVFHDDESEGCAVTCFVTGYATDEERARRQWSIALKLVENALGQATRGLPGLKSPIAADLEER